MVLGGQIESPNIEVMQHGFAFPTCIAGLLGQRVIDSVDVGGKLWGPGREALKDFHFANPVSVLICFDSLGLLSLMFSRCKTHFTFRGLSANDGSPAQEQRPKMQVCSILQLALPTPNSQIFSFRTYSLPSLGKRRQPTMYVTVHGTGTNRWLLGKLHSSLLY